MRNILPVKTISVPIADARTNLCSLVDEVNESGVRVLLTAYGKPKAQIVPYQARGEPWRAEKPDDPARYGDLQKPVLEDWK